MEDIVAGIRERYLEIFSNHMSSMDETPMYICDLVMLGLMDRNIGIVESMPKLIEDENIHAFAPLLRVQLDGLLRLHAFRLVENAEDLAHHIIKGNELRGFKDRKGKKLTDRYLVNSLKLELPWVESMYDKLCGWVHLSDTHVFTAATEGKSEGSIYIGIGRYRQRIPPALIKEAIESIKAIHHNTALLIESYFKTIKSI
ncbi:MAG: hypothetical protein ABW118_10390 [Candidatus Thiodiazotropha sp.]